MRRDYPAFVATPTRWNDNDQYGHVNNAVYYLLFDTAVNGFLTRGLGHDVRDLPALGVVAETSCRYLRQASFPDALEVGIALSRLGTSSVTYDLAVFSVSEEPEEPEEPAEPHATGRFVHVYVDPDTRRPVPVPEAVRAAVRPLIPATVPATV